MRKFFAAAATAATAGILAIGLAAAPAQASAATTQAAAGGNYKCYYTSVLLKNFHVLDSATNGKHDGLFGTTDLWAVKKGKVPASRDLRAAAYKLSANKRWWLTLDVAYLGHKGNKPDNLISREDLQTFLQEYC